jgi:Holliday junction resolvase RusA-like endonuclease
MTITFIGNPVPQPRPQVSFRNGHGFAWDPAHNKKEELKKQLYGQKTEVMEGALRMVLKAFMPIPKSFSQKKQNGLNGQYHISKPDLDNITKTYLDILEGICFKNDSQVCVMELVKAYSTNPRVEITFNKIYEEESTNV